VSILDLVNRMAEKHPEVSDQQHSSLLQAALDMFGNAGGISSLLRGAESQGLGHIVQSWIGTGNNQSIAPQQLESILGQDRIQQLAARAGIPPSLASAALSRILPAVVDKATPEGRVPQAA
jgi:uncharacterized protein YidB (DUF937 family)